jgi:hypothetical protein
MSIHTTLAVLEHAGDRIDRRDHDDPDTTHALDWIRAQLRGGRALLILLNMWTEHPHQPPADLFHTAGDTTAVTDALRRYFPETNTNCNSKRDRKGTQRIAAELTRNYCSPTPELLD